VVSVEDASALRRLSERYAAGIDRRDAELYFSAFNGEGCIAVHQPAEADEPIRVIRGAEEIGKNVELIKGYARTFHILGQSSYEIDGDRATGEVYCIAHHLSPDRHGGTNYVMYIRYEDDYSRLDGRWGIEIRRVRVDWTEVRSVGLPIPPSS
jgi:hypothetical protein